MSRAVPRFRRTNAPLPPVATAKVIQITVQGSVEGQMTINTFYYLSPPGGSAHTQATMRGAATAWQTAFLARYRAAISVDWTLTSVAAISLSDFTLIPFVDTTNAGQAGTGPAGHEPTMVASVISRITAVRGQHGRGRIYLPAVPTAWVTNSTVTLAAGTLAYFNVGTDMLNGFTLGADVYGAALVQRSKILPKTLIGAGFIINVANRPLLGTVRRRRIGRGR